MTKGEFLALPKDERKRLAATRSNQRRKAANAGTAIPPTYAEEFGLSKRKPRPVTRTPRVEPAKTVRATEREARREKALLSCFPKIQKEPEAPFWRTICGDMLHCVSKAKDSEYMAEAKRRGMDQFLVYEDHGSFRGILYFDEMSEEMGARAKAILVGTHPELLLRFGPVQKIA